MLVCQEYKAASLFAIMTVIRPTERSTKASVCLMTALRKTCIDWL